jgi:hypothetical protein
MLKARSAQCVAGGRWRAYVLVREGDTTGCDGVISVELCQVAWSMRVCVCVLRIECECERGCGMEVST